ncbi:MAG TPA: glycosyltransferase family 4 protein [Daejeonella sp.]|nr:glycosyltransferase family 4 protein [Daejeonella sp.]
MTKLQHVLIIGIVWPEPNSSAAGLRMMQLIHLFQSEGWKITFASAAADSEHMVDLAALDIEKVNIKLNCESFDEFILQLQPSMVLFDRFMVEEQFGWRVAKYCPQAVRVLETVDLHCLRRGRQQAFKEKRPFISTDLLSEVAKREIASILRCDLSLIISEVEMALLQDPFKVDEALLHYVPFLFEEFSAASLAEKPSFNERKHFLTIGNFLHEPNFNSVLYLKEEIWPLIRKKLPQAELHIYGAYPSAKVTQLHRPEQGFYILGRADDAKAVMQQARVCLAPLRIGAGIKGKLAEAMLCGTPSVTTDIGAESMHAGVDWNGAIANTAEEIALVAVKLYTDEQAWQTAQQNGLRIINQCHSKTASGPALITRILTVQKDLEFHRLKNFTGAMLMHHTMASTQYMSRWIEAKNKQLKD